MTDLEPEITEQAAPPRDLLTVADAAALTGLAQRTIYRAIARGELRACRVCSRLRIPREWFNDWIERGVVQPERALVIPPQLPA